MAVLNNSNAISPSGYDVNNSLRFRRSASAYLNRTPASAGNRRTWTWSSWIKRGELGTEQTVLGSYTATDVYTVMRFTTGNLLQINQDNGSGTVFNLITTQVFRDPSAWYHIVLSVDTTQATDTNRIKLYINGNQVTAFGTSSYPSQNLDTNINRNQPHYIGHLGAFTYYLDGYLAEAHFIDGSAKASSDFGETDATTGVWKPKAYTGTYGTNGFYLKFSDIATTSGSNAGLGKDFSGNTNYWTTNNISVTSGTTYDAMLDVPTNTSATVANYAVWNPLERTAATYSEANLKVVSTSSAAPYNMTSTIQFPTTGKWYCEVEGIKGASNPAIGMGNNIPSDQFAMYRNTGVYLNGGISGIASSGTPATWTTGDIIGIAYDASAGTLSFYKNGTLQSGGFTSIPATGYFVAVRADSASGDGGYLNCGQRPFAYTPPTGYVALNTFNLPTPTILQGRSYMDATLYTGTGTTQVLVNQGQFKPDFVWMKGRSNVRNNNLYDSVRGTTKELTSNSTGAESTNSTGLTAFNSNGWTIGSDGGINTSSETYVGWQWQAGQGSTSSNTSGTITSTVSVNTTAGFSVVTFSNPTTGSTIGHGLGVAPKMMIVKDRGSVSNWQVYHASLGNNANLRLNLTDAQNTPSNLWNTTTPTSTVFTFGSGFAGSYSYVVYCWAEIAGFSKFGSYTGNGSTDGPFVFTNLKPRFIMIKRTDTTSNWTILDTAREGYNVDNDPLYPNLSDAEGTTDLADILSNGFKLRSTDASVNANTGTYIYAAFAESPFSTNNRAR
jgi:hypothetical protein